MPSSIRQLKQLLRDEGLAANKRLGQNFLINQSVVERAIVATEIGKNDTILEIGPGLGVLTEAISGKAGQLIAVEKDDKLISHLQKRFVDRTNIDIIEQDIFQLDFAANGLQHHSYKVVANLPFYITSHFLRFILEKEEQPQALVLIIQKEVAERIVAKPGSHSLLSLSVQFYGDPEIICSIDRRSFYPAPVVDAALLKITLLPEPRVKVEVVDQFFKTLKIGFSSRRKQLRNNMAAGWKMPKEEADRLLKKADIDPTRRAESLSLNEWQKLYKTKVIHKK